MTLDIRLPYYLILLFYNVIVFYQIVSFSNCFFHWETLKIFTNLWLRILSVTYTWLCAFLRYEIKFRRGHQRSYIKKLFLKIWQYSQKNTCVGGCADLNASNFIKKRLKDSCFPLNLAKFLEAPILKTSAKGCFGKSGRA